MVGTTNTFSSNISLALTAAPQGVYDPSTLNDTLNHFSSTQKLSSVLSDCATVKLLFLVGVTAGKFISISSNPSEALGIPAPAGFGIGFLTEDVAPGTYGTVYSSGINSFLTGLSPGVFYYTIAGGNISSAPSGAGPYMQVGFASNTTTLIVQNIKSVPTF